MSDKWSVLEYIYWRVVRMVGILNFEGGGGVEE